MPDTLHLAMIGEGAIADVHMQSLQKVANVDVPLLVYGKEDDGRAFAEKWKIDRTSADLKSALTDDIDGLVIASPSGLHARQAKTAIAAGKHTLIEIPVGLSLADCQVLADLPSSRPIVMACHTRRFSPAHRWIKAEIDAGRLSLQHLVAQTFFFRRENLNMAGNARSWVDSLLWHHAAHTIDLFIWLTGDSSPHALAQAGPDHSELGIPMDMTIGLKASCGALLTLSLSFNNRGPFGGFYRYIGSSGTYDVFRDTLKDHNGNTLDVQGEAFLDQDQAFVDAIRNETSPSPTPSDVLPAMRVIDRIDRLITQ